MNEQLRTGCATFIGAFLLCVLLTPTGGLADQNHPGLDPLFTQLKTVSDQVSADRITGEIWGLWRQVDDNGAATALAQGTRAMSSQRYREAYHYFSEVIERAPDFAEGWNKRATVLYLAEAYDRSIQDIKETLRREPRHFGALSGLGLIFLHQRQYAPAANAFRNALAINPHLPRIRRALDQLEQRQRAVDEENTI